MPGASASASSASECYFTGPISPGFRGRWAGPGRSWVSSNWDVTVLGCSSSAGMSLGGSEQRRDVT